MLAGELVNIIADRVKSIHQSDHGHSGTWFYTKGGIYKATADMSKYLVHTGHHHIMEMYIVIAMI